MEARRREISRPMKQVIVELYSNGEKGSDIVRSVSRSLASVYRVIGKFQRTRLLQNLPRSGRPRFIGDREYRRLQRTVNKDPLAPLGEITERFNENRPTSVSKKTIKRRLKENGFFRGVFRKKVVIKTVNRKKRLSWCREKRWWTVRNQLSKVIFSDESQICVGENNRVYVWKKTGEGWRPDLAARQNGRKFSIMVWGCLCFNDVGNLCQDEGKINSEKYIDILDTNLWPVIACHFPDGSYLFQDDNAPVHRSRLT